MSFDKFMDHILVQEEKSKKKNLQKTETPTRELAKRYREKPQNLVRYVKK